jgi:hypothetical protein
VRFLWAKGLNAMDIHKEMLESVCRVKRFHLGRKRFADDVGVETEMQKWLRRQSKEFFAAGFDALVKRWDKCTNVVGGYIEK